MKPVSTSARRLAGDAGYVLALAATILPILLLSAAMAIDFGSWRATANESQRAVDAASLAAVGKLVEVERDTGKRSDAEAAATALAMQVLQENGVDAASAEVTASVQFFTDGRGVDHAAIDVRRTDLGYFFSGMLGDRFAVKRSAEAAMSRCQAICGLSYELTSVQGNYVETGVGGDGWQPVQAGEGIFNLYHHKTGAVLYCTDTRSNQRCAPGGDTGFYPVEPYPGMGTNYTPKIAPVGNEAYFVVQTSSRVGLGCWSAKTHGRCPGFSSPLLLANYANNSDDSAETRIDGPERIGKKLYMFGDDQKMYCYDTQRNQFCAGYPAATSLLGTAPIVYDGSVANGFDDDGGLQFDMLVHPDGRIWNSLIGRDSQTWVTCWDTKSGSPCAGWKNANVGIGRVFLFFGYDTAGNPNVVCGRAGSRGGGPGIGHGCVDLAGNPRAPILPWDFEDAGDRAGQQSATAWTTAGHLVTYFPFRNLDGARCWDWTAAKPCAITPTNWDNTEDYAYWYDGINCMFGLGHKGKLFSFSVDTGQFPCRGSVGINGLLEPCTCADGVTKRWTSVRLLEDTLMSDFTKFEVTLFDDSGKTWVTTDLVATGESTIDLEFLNDEAKPPTSLTIRVVAELVLNHSGRVYDAAVPTGIYLESGVRPSLVD